MEAHICNIYSLFSMYMSCTLFAVQNCRRAKQNIDTLLDEQLIVLLLGVKKHVDKKYG